MNQQETLEAKEGEIERERQVKKKDEDGIVTTGTLMDKSNDWPSVLKNCRDRGYRGGSYKLADGPGKLNARKDLDGRDE